MKYNCICGFETDELDVFDAHSQGCYGNNPGLRAIAAMNIGTPDFKVDTHALIADARAKAEAQCDARIAIAKLSEGLRFGGLT